MRSVSFRTCEDVSGRRPERGNTATRVPTATSVPRVRCSFDTRQFGVLQVEVVRRGDRSVSVEQLTQEPDLNLFTDEERTYIEGVCAIVYRFAFQYRNP